MLGPHRVIVGVSSSPGCLPALRYARSLALREEVPLLAVHAWVPPGGDVAERRVPSPDLRKAWAKAASNRLRGAIVAAWHGSVSRYCLARGHCAVLAVPPASVGRASSGLSGWSFRHRDLTVDQVDGTSRR